VPPARVAPYFAFAALIHVVSVATLYDKLAAKLPAAAASAIMVAQFPLLLLSGFLEGRVDHGTDMEGFPAKEIRARPIKAAFTFPFIYLCLVIMIVLDVSAGPIDPRPPLGWPEAQRVLWFAGFSLGMSFVFFLAAEKILIPVLRLITYPLQRLGLVPGAGAAVVLGAALGIVVFAVVTSSDLGDFVASLKASLIANPPLYIGVALACVFVPLIIGILLERRRSRD
jgi:hypothetical protein